MDYKSVQLKDNDGNLLSPFITENEIVMNDGSNFSDMGKIYYCYMNVTTYAEIKAAIEKGYQPICIRSTNYRFHYDGMYGNKFFFSNRQRITFTYMSVDENDIWESKSEEIADTLAKTIAGSEEERLYHIPSGNVVQELVNLDKNKLPIMPGSATFSTFESLWRVADEMFRASNGANVCSMRGNMSGSWSLATGWSLAICRTQNFVGNGNYGIGGSIFIMNAAGYAYGVVNGGQNDFSDLEVTWLQNVDNAGKIHRRIPNSKTSPTTNSYNSLVFEDSVGKRYGVIETYFTTDKVNTLTIAQYTNASTDTVGSRITMKDASIEFNQKLKATQYTSDATAGNWISGCRGQAGLSMNNSSATNSAVTAVYMPGASYGFTIASQSNKLYFNSFTNTNIKNGTNTATYQATINYDGTFTGKAFSTSSSKRYKKNIIDMSEEQGLEILKLRPVNYDYINENNGVDCQGFIAEEVNEVNHYPVICDDNHVPDGLDYSRFVPSIVKLCQIQQKKIEELEDRIKNLEQ